MTTLSLMPEGRQRYFNNDGTPCAGGKLWTYAAGTTNPKATYADAAGTVPNANPVPLDAKGEAVIYWSGAYKTDLKQADGQQVTGYPVDNFVSPDQYTAQLRIDLLDAVGLTLLSYANGGTKITAAQALDLLYFGVANVRNPSYAGGAKGDGVTNDTAAFNACKADCLASKKLMHIPATTGAYLLTAGAVNFAAMDLAIEGTGMPTLKFAGAGQAFVLDQGGANGEHFENMRVENLRIVGGPNITDGFYSRGIVRSVFRNIEVREVTGKAFYIKHGVSNTYDSLKYSAGADVVKAARGLQLANNGAGYYTADCTFINLICEDFPGLPCYIEDGSGNVFMGGTFEGATKGLVIASGCRRNTFKNLWCEANTTQDLEDGGVDNSYDDCYFGSSSSGANVVVSTGQGATFLKGYVRTANLQSTSRDTLFVGVKFDQNLSGTLGITGPGTYKSLGCLKVDNSLNVVGLMPDVVGDTGTWTPGFAGDSVAGAPTYSAQVGTYYRLGKMVFYQATVVLTGMGGATGNVLLTGFPVPAAGTAGLKVAHLFAVNTGAVFTGTRDRLTAQISPSANYAVLIQSMDGYVEATMPVGQIGPGTYVISGTYLTN